MKVTVVKEWQTEDEIEAPDGLTEEELKQWLAENVDDLALCFDEASWAGTYCINTETDEDICDWS